MSNVTEDVVWSREKTPKDLRFNIMKIGTKAQVKCRYRIGNYYYPLSHINSNTLARHQTELIGVSREL